MTVQLPPLCMLSVNVLGDFREPPKQWRRHKIANDFPLFDVRRCREWVILARSLLWRLSAIKSSIREKIIASVLSSNALAILDSEIYKSRIIKTCWLLSIWGQIVRDGSCLMHLNRVSIIDPISRSPFLPSWNLHKVELFSTFISHLGDISSRKCSRKCKFLWKKKKILNMSSSRIRTRDT